MQQCVEGQMACMSGCHGGGFAKLDSTASNAEVLTRWIEILDAIIISSPPSSGAFTSLMCIYACIHHEYPALHVLNLVATTGLSAPCSQKGAYHGACLIVVFKGAAQHAFKHAFICFMMRIPALV